MKTGKRVWHQQLVKHDIWNYDTPTAPILLDVNVGGRRIPGLFQITKQSYVYSFNRHTGEPIWPMESGRRRSRRCPGEKLSKTQPHPTKPTPYELQGRKESDLIDYTPEIRKLALERAKASTCWPSSSSRRRIAATRKGKGPANICPGGNGGANITGPPGGRSGRRHHLRHLVRRLLADAAAAGEGDATTTEMTGKTLADWVRGGDRRSRRRRRPRTIRCAAFPISSRDRSAASSRST